MALSDPRNVTFADLVKRGFNALQMDLEEARGDADLHDRGKTWANEAVEELAAVWDWPRYSTQATLATTADQEYVALPSTFGYTGADSIPYYASNLAFSLSVSTREVIQHMRGETATSGQPHMWYIDNRMIGTPTAVQTKVMELYPTPGSVYSFIFPFYALPTPMADPTDTPDVDPELKWLLQKLVDCRFHEGYEQIARASGRDGYESDLGLAVQRFSSRRHNPRLPMRRVTGRRAGGGNVALPFNITLP